MKRRLPGTKGRADDRKFILLDFNLGDCGGHYHNYDRDTLSAAGRLGYVPVLLCSREASVTMSGCEVIPVFRYSMPETLGPPAWFVHLFGSSEPSVDAGRRNENDGVNRGTWLGVRLLRLATAFQRRRCVRALAEDTENALRDMNAGAADIIFVPTVSSVEIAVLRLILAKKGPASRSDWHLLFHRNLDVTERGGDIDRSDVSETCRLRRELIQLRLFLRAFKIHLYTDTAELAQQYSKFESAPFRTLPIPHAAIMPGPRRDSVSPLTIIYAGDARREKGYHLLPGIVRALWADYVACGRVIFSLQSNFNHSRGECGIGAAKYELQRYPSDKVRLIEGPLGSTEYSDLLDSGDVNLLLYNRREYRSRSSGVLAESLCLGLPVVTFAGTWLSRQFIEAANAYLMEVASMGSRLEIASSPFEGGAGQSSKCAFSSVFRIPLRRDTDQVIVEIEFCSPGCAVVAQLRPFSGPFLMEAGSVSGRTFKLLQIARGQSEATLTLRSPRGAERPLVRRVSVYLLSSKSHVSFRPPAGAVGTAAFGVSDVYSQIREIIEHHAHYKATAKEFSRGFSEQQNGDELIRRLIAAD